MIITNGNGTIKKTFFDGKVYDIDGNEVDDFSFIAPKTINNAVVEKAHVLTTSTPHGLEAGDDIQTVGSDNIKRSNIVKYAGTNSLELEEAIKPNSSEMVNIYVNYNVITFTAISNGFYKFSDNEGLIISDSYLSLFISYASLKSRYHDLTRNTNIRNLNKEALNSVFGDFSSVLTFYRKVDTSQIRELLIRKMLCIVTKGYDNKKLACEDYKSLLKTVTLIVESDEDNQTDPDLTDDDSSINNKFSVSFKYGER